MNGEIQCINVYYWPSLIHNFYNLPLSTVLRLFFFISYSLHCEIETGNTFLVIGNNKYAIHDGFKGRKGRSLYSPLDPSLQEDLTIHIMAANTHIQFKIELEFVFKTSSFSKKTMFFLAMFYFQKKHFLVKKTRFFKKNEGKIKTIYITSHDTPISG